MSSLLRTLGSSDSPLANPRRYRDASSSLLDHGEFVVGEAEVDGVAAGVSGSGSPASFGFHEADITVKQKSIASDEFMLYDKCMTETQNLTAEFIASLNEGDCIIFRKAGTRRWSMAVSIINPQATYGFVKVGFSSGRTKILSTHLLIDVAVFYRAPATPSGDNP